jgi:Putative beta-barrel porin-2, OmpL-like. bbp2
MTHRIWTLLSTAAAASLLAGAAFADDQATPPAAAPDATAPAAAAPAAAAAPTPPPAPLSVDGWLKSIKLGGHLEVGATMNPMSPPNDINFGHLFTDKANQIVLNQAAITVERDLDPKATWVDVGFKIQAFYGMDGQFTQFLGELPHQPANNRNQFDLVEANFLAHLPIFTPGGTDVKAGQFSTPLGNEVIDPTGNFFYSKTYIFNFGIPLKHTGILFTTHVNPLVDIYYGYTTGVNTSIGSPGGGYNADQPHFLGGFGLNFAKVTVLALTHIGPEDPASSPFTGIHSKLRYLNDIVVTWKPNAKLTSVTELNYIHDDGNFTGTETNGVSGGGVAEYLTYPLSPIVTAGLRGEIWRDNNGFFVAGFPNNNDFVNAEYGRPNSSYNFGPATYGELTLGLNIKPAKMPKEIDGLTVRPEIRWDHVYAGHGQFGDPLGSSKDQVTLGIDLVVPFNF